jgi:hypothetical protein
MLRRVALVRTDVSEELSACFIRVTRIGELGTTLVTASVVPSSPILVTLMKESLSPSETSVLARSTWCNIPKGGILHSHRRENLKSYNGAPLQFLFSLPGKLPLRWGHFHLWRHYGWTESSTRLEVGTAESTAVAKRYFRKYTYAEFHEFILWNSQIFTITVYWIRHNTYSLLDVCSHCVFQTRLWYYIQIINTKVLP